MKTKDFFMPGDKVKYVKDLINGTIGITLGSVYTIKDITTYGEILLVETGNCGRPGLGSYMRERFVLCDEDGNVVEKFPGE